MPEHVVSDWTSPAALRSGHSVIVPVYNGAETLEPLIERLEPVLSELGKPFEVILVNDGSRDASWAVAERLAQAHPCVRSVNLMRNYGQHNALLCGLRLARYDVAITMDDDLQHPPEELPKLLARLDDATDVVYGTPQRERHGLLRNLASRITKVALARTMGAEVARNVSALRALRTHLRAAFASHHNPFVSIDVLLTWGTTRFAALPVRHESRAAGESNYTVAKLITHAVNMITGYSTLPLQLASMIGFASTLFGLGVLAYVLGRYFIQGAAVPGFAFLASIITLFAGAQLFSLGIIGEYLARIHFRAMERPTYTVGADTGPSDTAEG